jgi:polyphenol oxidase
MWTGTIGAYGSPPTVSSSEQRPTQTRLNSGSYQADWVFSGRGAGVSESPFDSLNLADHVGDDSSAVTRNRQTLLEVLDQRSNSVLEGLVVMQAVHGNTVEDVSDVVWAQESTRVRSQPSCDGLVTNHPNIALAALSADCVPVVLADISHGVVGAVHCGWRGVVSGVVDSALGAMQRLGGDPESTTALVGPAICGQCYTVAADRAAQVAQALDWLDEAGDVTWQGAAGQWHVDVRLAVIAQLSSQGVRTEAVGGCTYTDDRMFSFRRDGTTGRQGAAIVLSGSP